MFNARFAHHGEEIVEGELAWKRVYVDQKSYGSGEKRAGCGRLQHPAGRARAQAMNVSCCETCWEREV